MIMASINELDSSSYSFTINKITGFSGVTFGSVGVMVGSSFYYVGRLSSYGGSMA